LWNVKVEVILRIIGATGSISKAVEYICGKHSSVELQKIKDSQSLRTVHILGRSLLISHGFFRSYHALNLRDRV
jgi:hypothetical protein